MRLSYHFEEQFFDNGKNAIRHTLVNRLVANINRTLPHLERILAIPDNRYTKIHAFSAVGVSVREPVPFKTIRFLTELYDAVLRLAAGKLHFRGDDDITRLMKLNECLTYVRKHSYQFTQPFTATLTIGQENRSLAPEVPSYYITSLRAALEKTDIRHSPYGTEKLICSVRLNYQIKRLEKWKQIYREESPFYDQLESMARGQIRTLLPERILVGAALDMLTDDWSDISRRLKRHGIHPSWKFLYLVMNCYAVPKDVDDARVVLNTALPLDEGCAALNDYLFRRPALSKLLLDFVQTDSILPTMDYGDWYCGIQKGRVHGNS